MPAAVQSPACLTRHCELLPMSCFRSAPVFLAFTLAHLSTIPVAAQSTSIDFGREIRPLLARKCYACHGPDKGEGGLHLHERDAAFKRLESGEHAIVPGKSADSALIARVTTTDHDVRMPPEGKPLTPEEVDLLKRWIESGATWQLHWAFQPVQDPPAPAVQNPAWVRNPIDAFVLAKLEQHNLPPNPQASAATLLRRLSVDLTGLPPSFAEMQAFQTESAANPDAAYEAAVDRLLASERYGEQWARHWLDVVRFAETNSFERDGVKPYAWRYRDYVIRSLNEDKPYDRFLKEQLAGDELPDATADSLIATGFYRLGVWDDEPADRLLAVYDGYDDIVTTIGQGMLAMTVNCARCHDHKIDPIPAADYYSFVAFIRNLTPNGYENPNTVQPIFPNPGDRERYETNVKLLREKQDRLQAQVSEFENEFRGKIQAAAAPAGMEDLDDLEYRFYRETFDKLPDFDALKPETVARLERPFFDIRPATRENFFGFVFTGVLKVPADGEYTFTVDSDDGVRLLLEGKEVLKYDGIHGVGSPQVIKVALKQGRVPVRLDYFQGQGGKGLSVQWSGAKFADRFLSATTADGTDIADLQNQTPGAINGRNRSPISEQMKARGQQVLGAERFVQYEQAREALEAAKREKPWDQYALCVTEHGPTAPETFILRRGNPQAQGDLVEPAFLGILGGGPAKVESRPEGSRTTGRRMELANWIASTDNPLATRVIVNRLWQHHFSRGIVRSPNNFGQLGEPPTHPELLDWLASELVRQGWKLKPLHKLMVMSNTYRQSSMGREDGLARDPANDWFWRYNLRRLSAEELRDSVLAVNGRLNPKMYGPGIYPEISQEVLAGQSQPGSGWGKSSYEEQARRSVYIHVKRSLIVPELSTFDFPDTDTTCEARFHTTQPGQALSLLNGAFFNQQAEELATRVKREAGEQPVARIARVIELVLDRPATPAEIDRGRKLIETLQSKHQQTPDAAFNHYCLMVLNLNEFIYVE